MLSPACNDMLEILYDNVHPKRFGLFFQEYVTNITEFMIFCNLARSIQFSIDTIRNRKILSGSGKLSGKYIFNLCIYY